MKSKDKMYYYDKKYFFKVIIYIKDFAIKF